MSQDIQNYDPVFLAAIGKVLAEEGGYVNDPADPGGETNFGISKRSFPTLDIKNLTRDQAIEIYSKYFWLRPGFNRLKGDVAVKVFDLGIVIGDTHAVTLLQRALRACGAGSFAKEPRYPDDGTLDLHTVEAANSFINVAALLAALRSEAAGYFRTTDAIAHQTRGGNHPFLAGWLKRAYS
ncbi:MAG: glycosyl hydrolase 108 family protein [Candidatus Binatus sp.]